MNNVLVILLLLALTACDGVEERKQHNVKALQDAGYTSVVVGKPCFLCCGRDDMYRNTFTAVGPTGRAVSGQVCAGWYFKGITIRLD